MRTAAATAIDSNGLDRPTTVARLDTRDRAKNAFISVAAEHSGAPLFVLTREAPGTMPTITYVNRAFSELFGYAPAEIVGSKTTVIHGPLTDLETIAMLGRAMHAGRPQDADLVLYAASRAPIDVDLCARPITTEVGEVRNWVVTLRDITRQVEAARLLARQAKRMRALYEITNVESHSDSRRIEAAIELGVADLNLDFGFVGGVSGEILTILTRVGSTAGNGDIGTTFSLKNTWAQEALGANDVRAYDDLGAVGTGPSGATPHPGWGAYIVAPINVEGAQYGVIGLIGASRGAVPFTETDREFVRLIGAFVGTAIERKQQRDKLDSLAFSDALTGLANRAMLFDRLEMSLSASRRYSKRFALHYLDLDGFKSVNDRSGHAAGDRVLQIVAKRLRAIVRESDTVARIGGDEFVVMQAEIGSERDADTLANRVTEVLREPFEVDGKTFSLGASVGVALFPDDGNSVRDLLDAADGALYRAKAFGKGKAIFA